MYSDPFLLDLIMQLCEIELENIPKLLKFYENKEIDKEFEENVKKYIRLER
jgi:hypothetical protein